MIDYLRQRKVIRAAGVTLFVLMFSSTGRAFAERLYKKGEAVRTGDLEWKILAAKNLGGYAPSNNMFVEDARTEGYFVLIKISIKNKGREAEMVRDSGIDLVDSRKRVFNTYPGQRFYVPRGAAVLDWERIPPGLSRIFYVVFEVAQDSKDLKLRIKQHGQVKTVILNLK